MSKWDDDAVARMMGQIQKNTGSGSIRQWEVETPNGYRIRTDGSEQDNQSGLAVLRTILESHPDFPRAPSPHAVPVRAHSSLDLKTAIRAYGEVEALAMKPNTWAQRKRALEHFCRATGQFRPVDCVTKEMASKWADDLLRSGQSKPYVANQVSHVAQLFESLIRKGIVETNPVKGIVVAKKAEKAARRSSGHAWEAFEEQTLKRIFDPENFKRIRKDHVRWGAIIGLYTGARVGEIAQLYLRDFVSPDGIPCVKICADSDGQSIKTGEGGERLVPLHPDLLVLGIMDRVERLRAEGHERFFPYMRIDSAAGKGNSISKGFNYYLGTIGVKPRRAAGIIGIHSLRKTLIQRLQGWSPLSAERRRAIVGHEAGDPAPDTHARSYMRAWKPEELADFFPGLPWAHWLDLGALHPMLILA